MPFQRAGRSRAAFTLIEVAAALLVLGLLAGVGAVAYTGHVDAARDRAAELILTQVARNGIASVTARDDAGDFTANGADFLRPHGQPAHVTVDGERAELVLAEPSDRPGRISVAISDSTVHEANVSVSGDLAALAMQSWTGHCSYAVAAPSGSVRTWTVDADLCTAEGAFAPLGAGTPIDDGTEDGPNPPAEGAPGDPADGDKPSDPSVDDGQVTPIPVDQDVPGPEDNTAPVWSCDAPPPDGTALVLWARQWGVDDIATAKVDHDGNLYVAGSFSTTVTIGGATLTPVGGSDMFVAKVRADSTVEWVKAVGGDGDELPAGVVVTGSDQVYVVGSFTGTTWVGQTRFTAAGGSDMFVAQLDRFGSIEWVRRFGGPGNDVAGGLAVDGGALVLSGTFTGQLTLGADTLTSAGGRDAFVAKIYNTGSVAWARAWGDTGDDVAGGVSQTTNDSLLISGTFNADTRWGNTVIPRTGTGDTTDILMVAVSKHGDFQWARTVAGSSREVAPEASFDNAGFYYLTGVFTNTAKVHIVVMPSSDKKLATATLTPVSTMTSVGGMDAFVIKFDKSGALAWSQRFGGPADDQAVDLAASDDVDGQNGNLYVVGTFRHSATFGATTLTADPDGDVFVAKLNRNSGLIWARRIGGLNADVARVVTAGGKGQGNLYIASQYQGGTTYGDFVLPGVRSVDIVVARLDIC